MYSYSVWNANIRKGVKKRLLDKSSRNSLESKYTNQNKKNRSTYWMLDKHIKRSKDRFTVQNSGQEFQS